MDLESISIELNFNLIEVYTNASNVEEFVFLKQKKDMEKYLTFILPGKEHCTSKEKRKGHCLMLYMKFHFLPHNY